MTGLIIVETLLAAAMTFVMLRRRSDGFVEPGLERRRRQRVVDAARRAVRKI